METAMRAMPELGLAGGSLSSEVLSIVSHDLKSPLATISMAASLLDDSTRSAEERAHMLSMVKRATARMDRLIRDLLEVGRLDAGHTLPMSPCCADVAPVVREACDAHDALAAAASIALVRDVPAELPPVSADCDRILQVLSNLIGNAVKFTPPGGRITVSARHEDGAVVVSVSDSGPGLTAEEQARIFEPYWQAKRTASLGAGLGLKIAKGIVEAHGGRIWIESAPGRGTTFRFELPRA
jgi:signal transduction histidine kinase